MTLSRADVSSLVEAAVEKALASRAPQPPTEGGEFKGRVT